MLPNSYHFSILVLVICLTAFASDIFAPSLLATVAGLNTTIKEVQWSMSVFMIGVAVSQLIYAPLSEGIGRKVPMIIGLVIMLVGGCVCMTSTSIETLVLGRLIQGCGAGACASLWRSLFRETFSGDDMVKYSSYLMIVIICCVPSAPFVGAYLQAYFDWHASFGFMSFYTLLALLGVIFCYQETKIPTMSHLYPKYILRRYGEAVGDRTFLGISLSVMLSYGAFYLWFIIGPVLMMETLGNEPVVFGLATLGLGATSYALVGFITRRVMSQVGIPFLLRLGWMLMIGAGTLLLLTNFWGPVSLLILLIPMFFLYVGALFVWLNAHAILFTSSQPVSVYTGSFYGTMHIGGAALTSGLVSFLPGGNEGLTFSLIILICSIGAWGIYEVSAGKFKPKRIYQKV